MNNRLRLIAYPPFDVRTKLKPGWTIHSLLAIIDPIYDLSLAGCQAFEEG